MKLQEKVIFITGAAGGIGKAAALVCAGYGAKVVAVDLNEAAVTQTAKEICDAGGDAIACKTDITKRDSVKAAIDIALKKYGRIDCLFNNAGVIKSSFLVDCPDEEFDFIMGVNAKGSFIVATEVAKAMIPNRKGRIINTSSISGLREEATNGAYCISKAAINMMTRVLALELGKYNISAVSVCPGHINTELLRDSFTQRGAAEGKGVDEYYKEMEATIALGRLGEPEEIGEFVAYLCDDRSAYIDGNSILVAGGKLMA